MFVHVFVLKEIEAIFLYMEQIYEYTRHLFF